MSIGKTLPYQNLETDIVVIGGGGTGLAAAVAAAEIGARVILLEKRALGGNSAMARGLCAADSPTQQRLHISAPKDTAFKIAMEFHHWKINPRIFRAFINKSGDTIRWLEEKGLSFTSVDENPSNQFRCFHLPPNPVGGGADIVKTLKKCCDKLGVTVFTHCPVIKIRTDKTGKVTGVMAANKEKDFEINTKSVIIASGGYGGNKELLKKYYPSYDEKIHLVGVPNMGDGLLMANEVGAANEGLGNAMLHPHVFSGSPYVGALAWQLFPVWVNKRGERFADETIIRRSPECGNVADRQPDKCVYVLFDETMKHNFINNELVRGLPWLKLDTANSELRLEEGLRKGVAKGDVNISDTWDGIAEWIGSSPVVLNATMREYNFCCDNGYDEIFAKDKKFLQALRTPPYYALKCYLSLMTTIGGIKINHYMEVLNSRDTPITGLYAGGDAVGGWQSDTYCMTLPGSALGFAISSGRIAGENAARFVAEKV